MISRIIGLPVVELYCCQNKEFLESKIRPTQTIESEYRAGYFFFPEVSVLFEVPQFEKTICDAIRDENKRKEVVDKVNEGLAVCNDCNHYSLDSYLVKDAERRLENIKKADEKSGVI